MAGIVGGFLYGADMPAYTYGYARVSTLEQDPELQRSALADAGCDEIYTDHASGGLISRPQLDVLLRQLRAGDTLVVWRLDRLGRTLKHLVELVGELGERGVAFRSLTEAIDTTTPAGRLLFHIMASLAEFERHLIRERSMAGLAAARARGRFGGRPPKMTPAKIATARRLYAARELTAEEIAKVVGVSRTTLYAYLREVTPVTSQETARRGGGR